jgi:carbon-monoxide dehydrogenase large subunit
VTPVSAEPEPTAALGSGTVGRSVLRKEDAPLLRGTATFVDDLHGREALHAVVLRSPAAHAQIARLASSMAWST